MSRYQEKPSRINVRYTKYWMVGLNETANAWSIERNPIAMFIINKSNIIIKTKTSLHWLQTSFTYLPKDDSVIFFQVSRCKTFVVFEVSINFRNDFLYRGGTKAKGSLVKSGDDRGMTYSWSGTQRLSVPPLVTLVRLLRILEDGFWRKTPTKRWVWLWLWGGSAGYRRNNNSDIFC